MAYDLTIEIDAKQTGLTMKGQFYDASGAVGSEITTGFTADTAGGYLWKGPSPSDTFTGKFVAYTGTYSLATRIGSIAITPANADFAQVDLKKVNGTNVTSSTDPINATVAGYASGQDPATLVLATPANKLATNNAGLVTATNGGSTAPTVDDIATRLLVTPANKLATDGTGRVTVGSNSDKTGYTVSTVGAGAITWASYGNMMPNGTVAASPAPTTTTFRGVGSTLGAATNFHIGQAVIWQNGQNFGKAGIITGYTSTKDITVAADDAWAFAPAAGDAFAIQGKVPKATS